MDEREMGSKVIAFRDLINNLLGSATSSERVDARRELVGTYVQALEELAVARRTTPDRESIIEECAKVCEMERDALRKNEAIWDANPNLRPDEDYVSEWEASACRGEEYAAAIRALKTAPTSDQGEKS